MLVCSNIREAQANSGILVYPEDPAATKLQVMIPTPEHDDLG
ncbi:hypothetical protein A2U01_0089608, partial [Trifolium medium]|nr:hypothetical protein [Trifolium medium]